ncbi:TPA: hypothetical protein ACPVYZ_004321 [Vibrio parahaemolyticus]|uniref:hypothetical protein n=1 Tax=Vibrio parahaemolyticus TaxID=670 RepID=UPI001123DA47|nr:hypothetical protein [Vibrio parahaemolyticus]MBE4286477.1 hypothetical protein [Vibrio parahaemolyticus]TOH19112.1 hypothetical protein CGI90_03805 [Vibrio parahaemolyticus]HCG7330520.1 hypothetical protein [Vibrio parahaemolyticus]HCG9589099.1 hypothetical protein [Vibrio parahaemolyticus]HCH1183533.1 hypothetical protein [Vibrio parahaemolyticus]
MTYKLNSSIELSKDLSRYARKCGQDDNPKWELGYSKVEFLKEQDSFYIAEPVTLDPNEPIERIKIDCEADLKGDFGLQLHSLSMDEPSSEQDKNEWLQDRSIHVPEGSTLEAMISKDLTIKKQPLTKENADFAIERLQTAANTPKADKLTVRAIISHCGVQRVRERQSQRIDNLAKAAGLSRNEAIWLANCHNDAGIIFEEGCWCTKHAKFYVAPTTSDLDELVKKGLLSFVDLKNDDELKQIIEKTLGEETLGELNDVNVYLPTSQSIDLIESAYL